MRDIGKNIKNLRVQKDMTQDLLAEKLFVTRQTISNYETGKSRPDVETLCKIADILGADIGDILYEPEDVKLQRRRILITLGLAASMMLLGLLLWAITDYAVTLQGQTFSIGTGNIVIFILRFAYFFLFGYLFVACVRLLQKSKPLAPALRKLIGWIVPAAVLLIALVFLPHFIIPMLNVYSRSIQLPTFWWKLLLLITQNGIWISLILGLIQGLCADWNQKL